MHFCVPPVVRLLRDISRREAELPIVITHIPELPSLSFWEICLEMGLTYILQQLPSKVSCKGRANGLY
jgi:hypothetical protein